MAGTFYSIEEAAEKLNKTQTELKEMVKEGKLREFRDGSKLLFKSEEVEALMDEVGFVDLGDTVVSESAPPQTAQEQKAETEESLPEEPVLESVDSLEQEEPTDDITMSETGVVADDLSDLTDADTALTGQGTSVLGQTDRDYELTDDTMAETAISAGTGSEAPLDEIEGDVNLDSFGSGSGLLDLSLQADDTSLGGILDEIYTTEGEGEGAESEQEQEELIDEIPAEPEQMIPVEQPIAQPQQEVEAMAAPLAGTIPDKQGNILGFLLILPLVAVFYTIIVAVAGLQGTRPSILTAVQNFIWYIVAAAVVVTLALTGVSFAMSGQSGTKVKQEKKPKPKKEKPVKAAKPKKVKEPKPKKEKKKKK